MPDADLKLKADPNEVRVIPGPGRIPGPSAIPAEVAQQLQVVPSIEPMIITAAELVRRIMRRLTPDISGNVPTLGIVISAAAECYLPYVRIVSEGILEVYAYTMQEVDNLYSVLSGLGFTSVTHAASGKDSDPYFTVWAQFGDGV